MADTTNNEVLENLIREFDELHASCFTPGSPAELKAKYYRQLDELYFQHPEIATRLVHDQNKKYAGLPLRDREEAYVQGIAKAGDNATAYKLLTEFHFSGDSWPTGGYWVNSTYKDIAIAYSNDLSAEDNIAEAHKVLKFAYGKIGSLQDGRDGWISDMTDSLKRQMAVLAGQANEKGDIVNAMKLLGETRFEPGHPEAVVQGLSDLVDRDPQAAYDILMQGWDRYEKTDKDEVTRCSQLLLSQEGLTPLQKLNINYCLKEEGVAPDVVSSALDTVRQDPDNALQVFRILRTMTDKLPPNDPLPVRLNTELFDYIRENFLAEPDVKKIQVNWISEFFFNNPALMDQLDETEWATMIKADPYHMLAKVAGMNLIQQGYLFDLLKDKEILPAMDRLCVIAHLARSWVSDSPVRDVLLTQFRDICKENPAAILGKHGSIWSGNFFEDLEKSSGATPKDEAEAALNFNAFSEIAAEVINPSDLAQGDPGDLAEFVNCLNKASGNERRHSAFLEKIAPWYVGIAVDLMTQARANNDPLSSQKVYEVLVDLYKRGDPESDCAQKIVRIFKTHPDLMEGFQSQPYANGNFLSVLGRSMSNAKVKGQMAVYYDALQELLPVLKEHSNEQAFIALASTVSTLTKRQSPKNMEVQHEMISTFKDFYKEAPEKAAYSIDSLYLDESVKKELKLWIVDHKQEHLMSVDPAALNDVARHFYDEDRELQKRIHVIGEASEQRAKQLFGMQNDQPPLQPSQDLAFT